MISFPFIYKVLILYHILEIHTIEKLDFLKNNPVFGKSLLNDLDKTVFLVHNKYGYL